MPDDVVWVDFDLLEQFMVDVFVALGASLEDAMISADVLITSDKRGIDSHGINRLKPIYYDRIKSGIQLPKAKYEVVRETSTTAVIDGNRGMGHATAKHAMELAIEKAKKYGLGMTVVRNSTHYGIAGYYVMMATEAGMIGITGTNARPSVAPTYGVEPMLGTNPLTIGIPSDEDFPFILDPATSIIQRGKVEVYARTGEKFQEGLVIDSKGNYMTDPSLILEKLIIKEASLLPIGGKADTGGYKGYGYSTVVELLSSALQGGSFLQAITGVNVGHFFLAIDIEAFTDLDSFKRTTGDILRALRDSKRMPSEPRIYTAGEKEHLAWLERKNKGVPLNKSLQEEILQMRDDLGLKTRFPFESY
jgi:LDH2 family malate/lactate/ureidoglycolate dehydrogenase